MAEMRTAELHVTEIDLTGYAKTVTVSHQTPDGDDTDLAAMLTGLQASIAAFMYIVTPRQRRHMRRVGRTWHHPRPLPIDGHAYHRRARRRK
jgi:hypothetical protein